MELETQRLRLRHWSLQDFDIYAANYADEQRARFLGGQLDRASAWRHLASVVGHWTLRGYGLWAVEEKESQKVVGSIGLWFSEGWPELELGYWLVPDSHGKGYATEAGMKSRDYAFDQLGAKTLVSYIDPANEPSKKVAERLGAKYENTIELLGLGPHCVYRYPMPMTSPVS